MTNYHEQHKKEFEVWRKGRNIQTESDRTILKVGDKVTFTNTNGAIFKDLEILGFDNSDFYGRFIYLNYDCYWSPATEKSLTKQ